MLPPARSTRRRSRRPPRPERHETAHRPAREQQRVDDDPHVEEAEGHRRRRAAPGRDQGGGDAGADGQQDRIDRGAAGTATWIASPAKGDVDPITPMTRWFNVSGCGSARVTSVVTPPTRNSSAMAAGHVRRIGNARARRNHAITSGTAASALFTAPCLPRGPGAVASWARAPSSVLSISGLSPIAEKFRTASLSRRYRRRLRRTQVCFSPGPRWQLQTAMARPQALGPQDLRNVP